MLILMICKQLFSPFQFAASFYLVMNESSYDYLIFSYYHARAFNSCLHCATPAYIVQASLPLPETTVTSIFLVTELVILHFIPFVSSTHTCHYSLNIAGLAFSRMFPKNNSSFAH